jgi:hypothetical protein
VSPLYRYAEQKRHTQVGLQSRAMGELILYAIPAFVLLLAVELWSFRIAADEDPVGTRG